MTLEQAVRRLTFDSASTFASTTRVAAPGWRPTCDLRPATVKCGKEEVVHDFPAGGWRIKETSEASPTRSSTQVLLEDRKHTGALPAASCATPTARQPLIGCRQKIVIPGAAQRRAGTHIPEACVYGSGSRADAAPRNDPFGETP